MGPAALEGAVRVLANAHSASIETIEGEALLEQNYPMIHTVGRAAAQAPRLIDMRWAGPDAKTTITLVGKGVCFDTGGLDIKPSSSMLLMKKDMGGAASVLGLASMIMDAGLPVTLRVLIPAVENSVSASSFRPGDVLTARNGITVENRNTDAEGRLVLGDALVEAASEDPDLIIDMATLTGAARVALGPDLPPLFTDGDTLAAEIMDAGLAVDDPVWRLPLWNGYDPDIGSRVAEITNAPSGGMAGSITAALFLRRFVTDPQKWAHFDIYGWAPSAKPGRPQGGECQAALACYKMIEDRCA
jgi:leucyl aminopeptidase